jgi:hypothetical protein
VITLQDAQWDWTPATWTRTSREQGLRVYSRQAHLDYPLPKVHACWCSLDKMAWGGKVPTGRAAVAALLAEVVRLIVEDGLDPKVVHAQFSQVKEYRQAVGTL